MRKPKNDILQGTLVLLVLKTLSSQGRMHGYALTNHIQRVSNDLLRVEEGSLYPALHRMEEGGLIRAKWMAKGPSRRVRIYDLTARGCEQPATEEVRWTAVADAVKRVVKFA